MSPEEFEKQLQQRPLRQVPAEWRGEILDMAKAAQSVKQPAAKVGMVEQFWTWFELRPKTIAALAAIWVVILALHFSTRDSGSLARSQPVSEQVMSEAREQRQFFAELAGLRPNVDAEVRKRLGPRSDSGRLEIV